MSIRKEHAMVVIPCPLVIRLFFVRVGKGSHIFKFSPNLVLDVHSMGFKFELRGKSQCCVNSVQGIIP